jgi:quinol monooxygenase YgiN
LVEGSIRVVVPANRAVYLNRTRKEWMEMAEKKVVVLARFKARAGAQEQLKSILQQMAQEAANDRGCLRFDLVQNEKDDTLFMFSECWTSQQDLENHLKMPYISVYRDKRRPFLDGDPEVTTWRVVSD